MAPMRFSRFVSLDRAVVSQFRVKVHSYVIYHRRGSGMGGVHPNESENELISERMLAPTLKKSPLQSPLSFSLV